MKNNIKIISGTLLCLLIVFCSYMFGVSKKVEDQVSYGSVVQANEYQSTTTTPLFVGTFKLLDTGAGSLAQVTITTAGTGSIFIYDATTTNGLLRTRAGTTTLASFNTTSTVGTYTFDSIFRDGLLVEVNGSNISSTSIMYRP